MKYILIASLLLVVVNALDKDFATKFMMEMKQVGAKCIAETGATDDDFKSFVTHVIPESHNGKCMLFCIHKNYNIQKEDGSVNLEGALKSLDIIKNVDPDLHKKMLKIFTTCGGKTKPDPDACITASLLVDCALTEAKAAGISDELLLEL